MESDNSITGRIKTYMAAADMLPLHLSRKTGIDNAVIYKCLNGKRNWNLGHLQLVAKALGVKISELVEVPIKVPLVGKIADGQGPTQAEILRPHRDWRPLFFKEDTDILAKLYDLEVVDRNMMPSFPPGTILTAQRDTSDIIQNENFVVYWGADGKTYIRHIILKSLTQGAPDQVFPVKHKALCDKILRVVFPLKSFSGAANFFLDISDKMPDYCVSL